MDLKNQARSGFHLMTKPTGSLCNLDCSYCFYLEKSELYSDTSNFRMKPEVLETYIKSYIEAQPGDEVNFAWQGGEPTLLGVDFYRNAVLLQKKYAAGKKIQNAFQTNGILINDTWADFFLENNFLVGISIDGPERLHDAYRVDRGGKPTFHRVMAAIELLKKKSVEFNTLTTVHRKNALFPIEVYRFLKDIGSGYIQFIPIVERKHQGASQLASPPDPTKRDDLNEVTEWSVESDQYGIFLSAIYDEWIKRDVGRVFVQQFDSALANWLGYPAGICVFSENCGRALAIEHNGDVFSCDHYVYPRYKLGNLMNTSLVSMVDSQAQENFGNAKSATLPQYCRSCEVRFACHGECPKHRFLQTPTGEPGLNYLCKGYKRFFRHIDSGMRTMGALFSAQQAPASIMQLPRSEWIPTRFK